VHEIGDDKQGLKKPGFFQKDPGFLKIST